MSNQYIDYIEFDDNEQCPIKRIGCLMCNATIAVREYQKSQKRYRVKYFSDLKKQKVTLDDKTYSEIMLCTDCYNKPLDLIKLTKTLHNGWLKEETWKYVTSIKPLHKVLKKKRFNLNANDPLPLSYFKQLFKNKKILRKGD